MRPAVITVAITGSVPRKKDNPALPVTVSEQIESTHEAFEAGASLVHIHVRNPDESSSSDPALFAQVQEGIRKHCPGMIVQFSTGGRGRDQAARGSALYLKPDMASLSTGSVNFPTIVYENSPALVVDLATRMKEHAHPAGDRGLRPVASSRRPPAGRCRADERPPARAVRHGRQERHAGRGAPAGHPAGRVEARSAQGDLDGGRHRAPSEPSDALGAGARRRRRPDRA